MIMTCTIEKVLADARMLVNRLRDHDGSADNLIAQAQTLHKRVDAMKQYQEDLNELNEVARHRPRSSLIMNLLQENTQIRELQQENKELKMSLEEHQSALELIMSKYREHIFKLVLANRLDKQARPHCHSSADEAREKIDKISEMASVMQRAIHADDEAIAKEQQMVTQLKVENQTLREILHIAVTRNSNLYKVDATDSEVQTDEQQMQDEAEETDLDSSIITVKEYDITTKNETKDTSQTTSSPTKKENGEKEEKGDTTKDLLEGSTEKVEKLQSDEKISKNEKFLKGSSQKKLILKDE